MSRYTIGGIAFAIDEPLPGLVADGFSDIEISTRFVKERPENRSGSIRRIGGTDGSGGFIDPVALKCWLPDVHITPIDRAWQLRQMAPLFSSLVRRLVLHASAVGTETGVVGFVAGSGVGKSTLAQYLSRREFRFVADDLLPVRFDPTPVAPTGGNRTPIAELFFLRRTTVDQVVVTAMDEMQALDSLVRNGFGEHADSEAWGFQFDSYHRLISSVPCHSLAIPDDLTALSDVAEAVAASSSESR